MNNQPRSLGDFIAFKLNPFPVQMIFPDSYALPAGITVEIWNNGAIMPSITVPVVISGNSISFEITPVQLQALPAKKAQLFVKFGADDYRFEAPIIPTLSGSTPAGKVINVSVDLNQTIRITSITDDSAVAISSLTKKLGDMVSATLEDEDVSWEPIVVPATAIASLNGGVANGAAKSIVITSNHGRGTGLRQTVNMGSFIEVSSGDIVYLRSLWVESVAGSITGSTFSVSMTVNGEAVYIQPSFTRLDSTTYQIVVPYFRQTSNDTVILSMIIGPSAPTIVGSVEYDWGSLEVSSGSLLFTQFGELQSDLNSKMKILYPYYQKSSIISKCVGDNVTNEAARLTDEIGDAAATSGELRLLPNKIIRTSSAVVVQGQVKISCPENANCRVSPFHNGDGFQVNTELPVHFENFEIYRSLGNANTATAIRFMTTVVNNGSRIRNMKIGTDKGLAIFKAIGLVIERTEFTGIKGANGAVAVDEASTSTTVEDLVLRELSFKGCTGNVLNLYSVKNTMVKDIKYTPVGSDYPGICFRVSASTAGSAFSDLYLENIVCNEFLTYGIYASLAAGKTLSRVNIHKATLIPRTGTTPAQMMYLFGSDANSINDVELSGFKIYNPLVGVLAQNVNNFAIGDGLFSPVGSAAGQRAFSFTNVKYKFGSFIRNTHVAADSITGTSSALT